MNRVFAYGSNLDPQRLKLRAPSWDGTFRRARLPQRELRFNKRSFKYGVAANIFPHRHRSVWGIVIELNREDLAAIDRCEGYPIHYDRLSTQLFLDDRREISAYVYRANAEFILEGKTPSSDYLDYVVRGARACGLPGDYIRAIARLGKTESSLN